ncbi:hypothetical protein D9M68_991320 [compost metagenome]
MQDFGSVEFAHFIEHAGGHRATVGAATAEEAGQEIASLRNPTFTRSTGQHAAKHPAHQVGRDDVSNHSLEHRAEAFHHPLEAAFEWVEQEV